MSAPDDDTAIGGAKRSFQSTLWTVVLAAKDPSSPDRREALQQLIETYWKPVYLFIRRRGNDREASKDLAQGFFTALLERQFLQYVQRDRGKFRTFLLTALEHFMADEHDRAQHRMQRWRPPSASARPTSGIGSTVRGRATGRRSSR
jgi:RNA polymerase sigma-70 factor (ECF subfamily)